MKGKCTKIVLNNDGMRSHRLSVGSSLTMSCATQTNENYIDGISTNESVIFGRKCKVSKSVEKKKDSQWNDRFYMQNDNKYEMQKRDRQLRLDASFSKDIQNSYKKVNSKKVKKKRKKKKRVNGVIPPIDPITKRRMWGKKEYRPKKYLQNVLNKRNVEYSQDHSITIDTNKKCDNDTNSTIVDKDDVKNAETDKENRPTNNVSKMSNESTTKHRIKNNSNNNSVNVNPNIVNALRDLISLDKICEIILDEYIDNISDELNQFCDEIINILIQSETKYDIHP
mmetsp:Transcript_82523/g.101234  ORF Transcript_82523/g.101234 Transcript_82523/m.101234 type:complete len:282 (-) Transcript_82523:38-883(-)